MFYRNASVNESEKRLRMVGLLLAGDAKTLVNVMENANATATETVNEKGETEIRTTVIVIVSAIETANVIGTGIGSATMDITTGTSEVHAVIVAMRALTSLDVVLPGIMHGIVITRRRTTMGKSGTGSTAVVRAGIIVIMIERRTTESVGALETMMALVRGMNL